MRAMPGEVTRIVVRWAPMNLPADTPAAAATYPFNPDGGHGYVWHCHIIDHEANEMMRPTSVIANPDPCGRTWRAWTFGTAPRLRLGAGEDASVLPSGYARPAEPRPAKLARRRLTH